MMPKGSKPCILTTPRAPIRAGLNSDSRFEDRFHEKPEQSALMAYDTMTMLPTRFGKPGRIEPAFTTRSRILKSTTA